MMRPQALYNDILDSIRREAEFRARNDLDTRNKYPEGTPERQAWTEGVEQGLKKKPAVKM